MSGEGDIPDYVSLRDTPWYGFRNKIKKVIYKSNADVAARMFVECTSLTEVDLAGSPREIGTCAFYNSKSLSSVKIPSSVTTVSEGAFDKCDALADVHYGGSRQGYG